MTDEGGDAACTRPVAAFFWRRLDRPGHDGGRLLRRADGGWRLSGMAVFHDAGRPCHLAYEVTADPRWQTRQATVTGWLGRRKVDLHVRRTAAGRWEAGGVADGMPDRAGNAQSARDGAADQRPWHDLGDAVAGCLDVDLSFTPATNLLALRRLALRTGQGADAPALWLTLPALRWTRLAQTYRRLSRTAYAYVSPQAGYAATLTVSPRGAVVDYPGLFVRAAGGVTC